MLSEKIKVFEDVSTAQNTTITSNKQSIFLNVSCGCKLTEHHFCNNVRSIKTKENTVAMRERSVFVELCNTHKI